MFALLPPIQWMVCWLNLSGLLLPQGIHLVIPVFVFHTLNLIASTSHGGADRTSYLVLMARSICARQTINIVDRLLYLFNKRTKCRHLFNSRGYLQTNDPTPIFPISMALALGLSDLRSTKPQIGGPRLSSQTYPFNFKSR